jgi:hypothetical protein
MEKKIEELEKNVAYLAKYVKESSNHITNALEKITNHVGNIEAELKIANAKIDKLDGNTDEGFGKVNTKLEDIRAEISKINDVTGYDGIFQNLKAV